MHETERTSPASLCAGYISHQMNSVLRPLSEIKFKYTYTNKLHKYNKNAKTIMRNVKICHLKKELLVISILRETGNFSLE